MKPVLSGIAGMGVLLAACAPPPPETAPGAITATDVEKTFLALDEDRDGMLSRQEVSQSPSLAQVFAQADANNDGMLNRYEYNSPSWRPARGEPD